MRYSELKEGEALNHAPESGWMLAYTRESVIFESYASRAEVGERLEGKELLELHLFDKKKEYRAVVSRSARWKNRVEKIIDFPADNAYEIYKDRVALEKPFEGSLTVLNHIQYDDACGAEHTDIETACDGMAYIDNYRLIVEEA